MYIGLRERTGKMPRYRGLSVVLGSRWVSHTVFSAAFFFRFIGSVQGERRMYNIIIECLICVSLRRGHLDYRVCGDVR